MNILGISCYYHDAAAALLTDGQIVAAAQEERFSRKKHDASFPKKAINFCLNFAKITSDDLDYVVFYEKPFKKFHRILISSFSTYPRSYASFREAMRVWLTQKLWIKQEIASYLKIDPQKIFFSEHHLSHAASCFYPSPFEKAAILTVDGVGEWTTVSFGVGQGNKIKIKKEIHFPNSLGLLYSAFTAFLGFKINNGEWKVMGMSPYGKPTYLDKIYKIVKPHRDGSFSLDFSYFSFYYSDKTTYSSKFTDLFGDPIPPNKSHLVTEKSANIACSIQKVTEELLLNLVKNLKKKTGLENLCLSGGVALNSVANYKLLKQGGFKNIYIQPAAGDSGAALGAALYLHHHILNKSTLKKDTLILKTDGTSEEKFCGEASLGGAQKNSCRPQQNYLSIRTRKLKSYNNNRYVLTTACLGQQWNDETIEQFLNKKNIKHKKLSEAKLIDFVVHKLTQGKIIGWMQGRFEWGPRALGNRSILADPRNPKMKDIINAKVKFREAFRPFAPSVLSNHAHKVFELPSDTLILKTGDAREGLPARAAANTWSEHEMGEPSGRTRKLESKRPANYNNHYPLRFMLYVVPVKKSWRKKVPAINHTDNTARPQLVYQQDNPLYYKLINRFYQKTGVPLVLNTSFNLHGKPIVASPKDAYSTYQKSGIDVLVMGNYVALKGRAFQ